MHHAHLTTYKSCFVRRIISIALITARLSWARSSDTLIMRVPKHVHLPIGQGNLPIDELLEFLSKQNYQGKAIVEEIGGGFPCKHFLEQAVKFRDRYREAATTKIAALV